MLTNIIICISAKQATVGVWRLGTFVSCTQYSSDEAGLAKFKLFISARRNRPVQIIVDAVEEDYRIDSIPHTSGRARNEVIQRKLLQTYRNAPYRSGHFLERETDKRRDDRILLMALTNADLLTPWLAILEEFESPVAGVYMMPMISQLLVKALKLKQSHLLLMTHQPAGLRQSYIANQSTRLSRLNPSAVSSQEQLERLYLSETEKTRLYLVSLRIITRETPIHLVYPATQELHFDLAQELENQQGITSEVIPLPILAKKIGLKAEALSRYPELLHMQALARGRMSANLLAEDQIKNYRVLQLAWSLYGGSALIIGLGLWLTLESLFNTFTFKQQYSDAQQQTQIEESRYAEVSANFPKTPVPGGDLKIAVELAQKFEQLNQTPGRLMQVVSEEVEKQPELVINRMRWKQTEDGKFADDLPGGGKAVANQNTFEPLPPMPPTRLYEIGYIDGEIRNFSGDYRAALESVATFANNLKKNANVAQVKITLQPVNTSSRIALQGSTLDQQAQQQDPALFQVKIFLKPETPKTASSSEGVAP